MSLSPIKQEILETMLLNDKPMKALDIAKEAKKEYQPVNMHLLGLTKMGYVSLPEKGLFIITKKGKNFLGIPDTTKEKAAAILAYMPHDKAFNFYVTVGKPLESSRAQPARFRKQTRQSRCSFRRVSSSTRGL